MSHSGKLLPVSAGLTKSLTVFITSMILGCVRMLTYPLAVLGQNMPEVQ